MVDEEGAKEALEPTVAPGERTPHVAGASVDGGPRVSPVPPPRSDKPPGRTMGPLLPMRIIGVNAVPAAAPSPSGDGAPHSDAPPSVRPPPSIPPPKPASGRPKDAPPPEPESEPVSAPAVEVEVLAAEDVDVSLTPPWPPTFGDSDVRMPPLRTEPMNQPPEEEDLVAAGPPPLPVERRSIPGVAPRSESLDGESPKAESLKELGLPPPMAEQPSLPPMAAPPAPPLRNPKDQPAARVSEPPTNRAGFDAPTPPETPAVRAEVLAARAAQEAKLDRSKPPALPTRARRSGEMESPLSSSPVASEGGSQPPPADGITKPKKRRPPPIPPPRSTFTGATEEESAKRRHWWEEVFGDDFLRAIVEPTDSQVAREVDFIEGSFNLEKPAAILDLACGAGRHAVELTRRGYTTVGYDLSVTQLARASESAQTTGTKVAFLHGDMREMGFEQMFDAVLCWNASFGYFEEEKNLSVLKNIHRALKPGGCLLLDIPNRDFIVSQQPAQNWFEGDGCVCMDDMHVDFITSRLCVKRTIMLDDGRNKECLYSIRLFGLHELGRMLHEIGFRVNEVTGHIAMRGVYMGATSPRLIMLVTKR
jgi:SAM-dependent methyltransferase